VTPSRSRSAWSRGAAATAAAAACLVLVTGCSQLTSDPAEELSGTAPLTGTPVDGDLAETLAERPLLMVKIANDRAARPQTGLEEADVVVEELVEGGVTRFVALYHSQLPDQVGPVRSARPVDVDVASGFPTPVFAYSGARAEVRDLLSGAALVSLTEGAPGFLRSSERRPPDNLYLVPADTLAAGTDAGAEPLTGTELAFDGIPPEGETTCPEDAAVCDDPGAAITVTMSTVARTGWTYDADGEVYRRDQDGEDSVVTGDGRIGAANVVVLATEQVDGGCCDTAGSRYVDTEIVGEGRAIVLRDGRRYPARWEKTSATAELRVLTDEGAPFPLKPGPTWLHLAPTAAVPAEPSA
jgi:hypothetical protein